VSGRVGGWGGTRVREGGEGGREGGGERERAREPVSGKPNVVIDICVRYPAVLHFSFEVQTRVCAQALKPALMHLGS
jgi:hypothetical protein